MVDRAFGKCLIHEREIERCDELTQNQISRLIFVTKQSKPSLILYSKAFEGLMTAAVSAETSQISRWGAANIQA